MTPVGFVGTSHLSHLDVAVHPSTDVTDGSHYHLTLSLPLNTFLHTGYLFHLFFLSGVSPHPFKWITQRQTSSVTAGKKNKIAIVKENKTQVLRNIQII